MPVKKVAKRKARAKYTVDCKLPIDDKVMDLKNFEEFLLKKIKVNNKVGSLGDKIVVSSNAEKGHVTVQCFIDFSKRYLKYLTKKYLKKQQIRDYLRVVASNKNSYRLKYFAIAAPSSSSSKKAEEPAK